MKEKIKVLFLAPHLSTGGMPSFLLKRLTEIIKNVPDIDPFVVEYSTFSLDYVVHRNKIIDLLPKDRFFTLGWFDNKEAKYELLSIIKENKIDIIHIEEMIEGFDSFNKVPKEIMDMLYANDRSWRVVETCHNVWFNPNAMKSYDPDAYAFCTPYHKEVSFKDVPSYSEVIQYPIEDLKISKEEKIKIRKQLNLAEDKIHVINVGLWTQGKNQKEGLNIAKILEDKNIQFHFIGNQASNFESYWKPLLENLPTNVTVWGERPDVSDFMKACDVFMFNSTYECNPLVLREAISYGLKIVARDLPQYMGMFDEYIVKLTDDLQKNSELLLSSIQSDYTYELPNNAAKNFADSHLNLYKNILSKNVKLKDESFKIDISQHYVGQPFIEITGSENNTSTYEIKVYDDNSNLHYSNKLPINRWVKLNREYFTNWQTEIFENDNLIYQSKFNLKDKRCYISFESSSLGDTISWIPYCLEFKNKHNCHVIVSTYWNKLFRNSYPELEFVSPGTVVKNLYAMYKLGWFYNENKEPVLPNTIPLQKAATNILGLDYTEIKPKISYKIGPNPYKNTKYITVATNSTAGCKFWTIEGWTNLAKMLNDAGYKVINVSKEADDVKGVEKIRNSSIEYTMNVIHHSEFFIGLSSGLSWLSWALGKHCVMISNFTQADHEFTTNCTRIVKLDVCNGCWNNPNFKFDRGDWYWCPIHKGTDRQFECHQSITADYVFLKLKHLIK